MYLHSSPHHGEPEPDKIRTIDSTILRPLYDGDTASYTVDLTIPGTSQFGVDYVTVDAP